MDNLPINPSFTDVVRAYRFLNKRVRHTPTEYSYPLSEMAGAPVYIKWENQQICGSFKLRGALYKMSSLNDEERARGVVTCSSGNHGQGVALAANELGIKTLIFVPKACPETKKLAIRRRGGEFIELIVCDGDYDFAEATAHKHAEERGMTYISSFEDPTVIAGQGTAGFEMFTDEPDIDLLLVPAGGGGLMNGMAIAAKAINPKVEIWGVQSVASNPWVVSWADGIVKEVEYFETLADGLAGYIPQSLLTLAKTRVSGIHEITEEDIANAIAFLHREHHQVAEGAGAVGVAALLAGKVDVRGRKTGIIISGGNIDEDKLKKILTKY
ncbi:MAG: threonine/serine dehydratase [Synergistaceae bacterium]|nr:threonine/serine dehydratase [Synergistaceae bacterium]